MRPLTPWILTLLLAVSLPGQVPSPKAVLGFEPGQDGMLANYSQILGYHRKLAAASDRVIYEVVGKTTEGRDFVSVIISAPENLARLDQIREDNARLADPRKTSKEQAANIIKRGKVLVLLNESIHSTEVGPAQAGMVTAHFLATTQDPRWLKVLQDVVLVLTPCHNPDGCDTTVNWWNQWKDTERRGVGLPVLYHKYVGHDNNRDWFMLTQAESRVTVVQAHLKWHPQIVIDQHQMGARGARMFVPPYTEPYEPFVHPLLRKQLESLGRSVLASMAKQGLRGVWCNRRFDAWTPARAFMHYHGGVRILTEVASARLADPIERQPPPRGDAARVSEDNPAPWKGGRWGLDDIVRYTSQGALLAIEHGSKNREKWLNGFYQVHEDFCAGKFGPEAWIVPNDPTRRLAIEKVQDLLALGGVEMVKAKRPFVTTTGREIPAGSLVIPNGQPYFGFACAMFENSPYPEIRATPSGSIARPYDMTCHSLPLLMDFEVLKAKKSEIPAEVETAPPAPVVRTPPAAREVKGPFLLDPREEGSLLDALATLHRGATLERMTKTVAGLPTGALLLRGPIGPWPLRYANPVAVPNEIIRNPFGTQSGTKVTPRRVGVYWSWSASMDEGWTRFFFDGFGVPFTAIRPADVRKGGLKDQVDVILFGSVDARTLMSGPRDRKLPDEYRGGIGEPGQQALREFVQQGGLLIAMNASSDLPIDLFDLPVRRSTGRPRGNGRREGRARPRTYIPGSVVRARVDTTHPIGLGCNEITPVFLRDARPFEVRPSEADVKVTFPLRYVSEDLVAGGYAEGAEVLHGKAGVCVANVGKGKVVLFAFSPQFRCQTWSTYRLLLNALLL